MSDFRKALLATAIPIGVAGIAAMFVPGAGGILLIVTGALCVAAIAVAISFGVTHRDRLASGTFVGLMIGVGVWLLAAMTTCFISPTP